MLDLISSGRCLHEVTCASSLQKERKICAERRKIFRSSVALEERCVSQPARNPLMWGQARLHYSGSAGFAFRLEGLPQVADRDIFR